MACRVKYDRNKNVIEVFAQNGQPSKLWNDLVGYLGDKNEAYSLYNKIRTSKFKKEFGDFENFPQGSSTVRDNNNEPLLIAPGHSVRRVIAINRAKDSYLKDMFKIFKDPQLKKDFISPITEYEKYFNNKQIFEILKQTGIKVITIPSKDPEMKKWLDKTWPIKDSKLSKEEIKTNKAARKKFRAHFNSKSAGHFTGSNYIWVRGDLIRPEADYAFAGTSNIFDHEGAHAYTVGIISKYRSNVLQSIESKLSDLYGTEDTVSDPIYQNVKLNDAELRFARGVFEAYNFYKKEPDLANEYGIKNEEEFVAEYLSNNEFRKKLAGNNPSVFQSIWNLFKSLFGIKSNVDLKVLFSDLHTYMAEVMKTSDVENNDRLLFVGKANNEISIEGHNFNRDKIKNHPHISNLIDKNVIKDNYRFDGNGNVYFEIQDVNIQKLSSGLYDYSQMDENLTSIAYKNTLILEKLKKKGVDLEIIAPKFKTEKNFEGKYEGKSPSINEDLVGPGKSAQIGEYAVIFKNISTETQKQAEITPNEAHNMELREDLNSKMKNFLDQIGVNVEYVKNLTDRNGEPMEGVAVADMLSKVVKVVEGKSDVTTLPEEAAHFFVEILKSTGDPLYNSMNRIIDTYEVYEQTKERYGQLSEYKDNDQKLRDEAIGKLITQHILNQEQGIDTNEKYARTQNWWQRVWNVIKRMFGNILGDPYKRAAYKMLNSSIDSYNDAAKEIQSTEQMLQVENSTKTTEPVGKTQDNVVESILRDHRNLELDAIEKSEVDLPKSVTEVDEENEISMYKYTDPITKEEIRKIKRVSFRNAINMVKKYRGNIDKVKEMNSTTRSVHARNNGVKLHSTAQYLAEYYGNKQKGVEIIDNGETKIMGLSQIKNTLKIDDESFKSFSQGVNEVIKSVKKTQDEIDPKGTVKLITEAKVYDKANNEAGTVDLLAVFSDGSVGILDWKFIINPLGKYTLPKLYGRKTTIGTKEIFEPKMDGWNTQISAYKQMLLKVHGARQVRLTRIIPAHAQFKTKKTKDGYTAIETIEKIQMGKNQNEVLDQVSVALEKVTYRGQNIGKGWENRGLNSLLRKFQDKRRNLKNKLRNVKGKKISHSKIKAELARVEKSIQALTVQRNILDVVLNAGNRIALIGNKVEISDPAHPDYLDVEDLKFALEDLSLFSAISAETGPYLKSLRKTAEETGDVKMKALAKAIQKAVNETTGHIQNNIEAIKAGMFDRLSSEAALMGEDLSESPKKLGMVTRNFVPMSKMPHPIFRTAYRKIFNSYNKTKHASETLLVDINKHKDALTKWVEIQKKAGNPMTLKKAYKMLIKDVVIKDKKGKETVIARNLIAPYNTEFYNEVKSKMNDRNVAWMKENFKIKEDAREIYQEKLKNKVEEQEIMNGDVYTVDNGAKVEMKENKKDARNTAVQMWEKYNNVWVSDEAWLNKAWQTYLEPKDPKKWQSEEFKEISKPGNKALLDYWKFYRDTNKKLSRTAGVQINANFIANVKDGIMDSLINSGFNMQEFFNAVSKSFLVYESEELWGTYDDAGSGKLIHQIPLPYMTDLTNSKDDVNAGLKSVDLSSSLFALATSVYNYKHMGEIEANVLALKDMLSYVQETQTDVFGRIVKDEDGSQRVTGTGTNTIDTFEKHVNYYLYGQKIQNEDKVIKLWGRNISMNRTVRSAMSFYSAKALGLALLPAVAARVVGGINAYIETIDGINYNKDQMRNSQKLFITQNKMAKAAATFFDPYQQGLKWKQMQDLSMKKSSRVFNLDSLYTFLRSADENIDTIVTLSMMQNHGIDKNGILQRLEDLPKGSKSMMESFKENWEKNGTIMVEGLTEDNYEDFRLRIKEVAGKQKGRMDEQDTIAFETHLLGQAIMQFKGWMPEMVTERLGGVKYNHILKTMEEGRYWGFLKGASWGKDAIKKDLILGEMLKDTAKRGVDVILELAFLKKFITSPAERQKLIDKGKWTDSMQAEYDKKKESLRQEFEKIKENSTDERLKNASLDEYLKMRQRSVRRTLAEVRFLLGFFAAGMAMGLGVGPDEEKWHQQTWAQRKLYMLLTRSRQELGFTLNPSDWTNMVRSPIPVVGLLVDVQKLVANGFEESSEMLGLMAEDKRDKTPPFYYTLRFFPGFSQMTKIVEFYPQDKKNPYLNRL